MKRKIVLCAAGAAAWLMLCGCTSDNVNTDTVVTAAEESTVSKSFTQTEAAAEQEAANEELLSCNYFETKDFDRFQENSTLYETNGEIICGTVPHHLLAGQLICGFFDSAQRSRGEVDTIIIVATLHEPELHSLVTSGKGWDTPFGKAQPDKELAKLFHEELDAEYVDEMMMRDHSASSIIPFASYFFPDSKVACLLVGSGCEESLPQRLSELIGEYSEEKSCLTVFSIDFSHYLRPEDTKIHDEETYEAVMSGDINAISQMTNSNVDSAPCLEAFTRLTENMKLSRKMLDHSNSLIMSAQPYSAAVHGEGLTSYYIFAGIQ